MVIVNGKPQETDVNIQSQVEPVFRYFMINELDATITLTSKITKGDEIINVSGGHGFTGGAGEIMTIWNGLRYLQARIANVNVNAIKIETPAAADFEIAESMVIRGNINMAVDGSVAPVTFKMDFHGSKIPIDIAGCGIHIKSAAAMDENKFGGIAALTNGVYLRREGSITYNFGNYKSNSDFRDAGAIMEYPDKAPAGTYAVSGTYNLPERYTKEARFFPRTNDILKAVVRDDLTGNSEMHVILFGSYTTGE